MLSNLISLAIASEVKRAADGREGLRATNGNGMPQTCYIADHEKKQGVLF